MTVHLYLRGKFRKESSLCVAVLIAQNSCWKCAKFLLLQDAFLCQHQFSLIKAPVFLLLIAKCSNTGAGPGLVAAERNSLSPFCHNMLSYCIAVLDTPRGNFGISPIVPVGKGGRWVFIWKWGTPGNDRHSLWTI